MKIGSRFKSKTRLVSGLGVAVIVGGLSLLNAQTPQSPLTGEGRNNGFESFRRNVFPLLVKKCAMCHSSNTDESAPTFIYPYDPEMTYRLVRRYIAYFGDLKSSKLVKAGTSPEMAGTSLTEAEFVSALQKWWDDGEKSSFFEGKKVLHSQNIPTLLNDKFATMRWDLGDLDGRLRGVIFEVELENFANSYELKNPKLLSPNMAIEVQGIYILINGIPDLSANTYSGLKTVAPESGILSDHHQIVLWIKGPQDDQIAFAFERIEPSTRARSTLVQASVKRTPKEIIPRGLAFNEKLVGKASKFVSVRAPIEFQMGSLSTYRFHNADETIHATKLTRSFAIQTTQVTQLQWYLVMKGSPLASPSYFMEPSRCDEGNFPDSQERLPPMCKHHPVEQVSWNDVQEFIARLNHAQKLKCGDTRTENGFAKALTTPGCYRLPTEQEWEYVARAGLPPEYSYGWGDDFDGKYAWYDGNSKGGTHAVATRHPIKMQFAHDFVEIYDMAGNVWEWVQDRYGDHSRSGIAMPVRNSHLVYRVLRGGSWMSPPEDLRAARREYAYPGDRRVGIGFRLVRTLK